MTTSDSIRLAPHRRPEWLDQLPFPADVLAAVKRGDPLGTTVGARYDELHAALARALAGTPIPDPKAFVPDLEAYWAARNRRAALESAESWLRDWKDVYEGTSRLTNPRPVVEDGGLVSARSKGPPASDAIYSTDVAPPQPPDWAADVRRDRAATAGRNFVP